MTLCQFSTAARANGVDVGVPRAAHEEESASVVVVVVVGGYFSSSFKDFLLQSLLITQF